VQQAVAVEPSPYDMIVGKTGAATQKSKPQAVGAT